MTKKSSFPSRFVLKYMLPALFKDRSSLHVVKQQFRRYFGKTDPEKNCPVDQISLRVNEACNLRCKSCGQWGENGHLLKKLQQGGKLDQLSFEVCKKIVHETKDDRPVYYIWGGEPSLWKPLVPLFEELAKFNLHAALVTNAHNIDHMIEPLIETGSLKVLFLSLDGWDAQSQNEARSPAGSKSSSNNFEKVIGIIDKVDEIKKRKKLSFPWIEPITVISDSNYKHLHEIRTLIQDKTQLHQIFYGWFITEQRAKLHETVFKNLFGFEPQYHRGYLKSCFNDVDPVVVAKTVNQIIENAKHKNCVPQFIPEIYSEEEIKRYYDDHTWDCGYHACESIYHVAEISPDGRVTPCRDYQDYICGNVNEQGFYDIWWGDKFKEFRGKLKKGLMPVCTRCCGLQGF
jgi:radical SAM protein with 4Fe4S-binding SPASM domain